MTKTTYKNARVIRENGNEILTMPKNTQDMNYHLYVIDKNQEILIDIQDVNESYEPIENLDNLTLKMNAWKVINHKKIESNKVW